tara:strand:- start:614170 stop:614661 length:492 start_codon:yes stop_codon:yes gene_type:complete
MKKIIMGVMAVLLLGGGAGGGYIYLKKPAEAALPDDKHAPAKEDKHAKGKGDHGEAVAEFVQLAPLILPILNKSGLLQTVSVVVALEVKNQADAELVKSLQPRITDAFIQEMYGVIHNPAGMVNGNVIKVGVLKRRLNKVGQRVLGGDVLQDVLLQVVQQRPI